MTIYLEVDGQPEPIEQCFWLHVAPCGCIGGVATAGRGGRGDLTTAEQAAIEFTRTQTKREADRDAATGHTLKLITRQQYSDTYLERFKVTCPHDPKWGIVEPTVPEGLEWRYKGPFSRARFQHLVDVELVGPGVHGKVTALCGAEGRGHEWVTDVFQSERVIDCTKCVKRAAKIVGQHAELDAKETADA